MTYRALLRVVLVGELDGDGRLFEVDCLHCDDCHRWGRVGSTHICRENWLVSARELVNELAAEEG